MALAKSPFFYLPFWPSGCVVFLRRIQKLETEIIRRREVEKSSYGVRKNIKLKALPTISPDSTIRDILKKLEEEIDRVKRYNQTHRYCLSI
jgi:CBS domain-containing protein